MAVEASFKDAHTVIYMHTYMRTHINWDHIRIKIRRNGRIRNKQKKYINLTCFAYLNFIRIWRGMNYTSETSGYSVLFCRSHMFLSCGLLVCVCVCMPGFQWSFLCLFCSARVFNSWRWQWDDDVPVRLRTVDFAEVGCVGTCINFGGGTIFVNCIAQCSKYIINQNL